MTGRHRGGRSLDWRLVVAALAAAVGRGYRGQHRPDQPTLGASGPVAVPVGQPAPVAVLELVRQPEQVSAASAHLSLVPVRRSLDPLVDTMPHPVIRLFPVPVADPVPVPVPDQAAAQPTPDLLPYRSRHSA